jgi:hypothetical protein
MKDTEHYMATICDFINTQGHLESISIDALRGANSTAELGITSLGAILLVANYLESNGVSQEFNPDWVTKLDSVEGIVSVFREIDLGKAKMLTE